VSIPFEIQNNRLIATFDPDFAADDSFGAIVDLAADYAIMNPECHERMKYK
jgi:hypothetical protein